MLVMFHGHALFPDSLGLDRNVQMWVPKWLQRSSKFTYIVVIPCSKEVHLVLTFIQSPSLTFSASLLYILDRKSVEIFFKIFVIYPLGIYLSIFQDHVFLLEFSR